MAGVDAFIGSWREEEKEGFDKMADALELNSEKRSFYEKSRTEITYKREGDVWTISVGMQGIPETKTFTFKLGEPYKSAFLDGANLDSMMVAVGDRFQEKHKDDNGMEMDIERYIEGGRMIVVTKVGALQMTSKYDRTSV